MTDWDRVAATHREKRIAAPRSVSPQDTDWEAIARQHASANPPAPTPSVEAPVPHQRPGLGPRDRMPSDMLGDVVGVGGEIAEGVESFGKGLANLGAAGIAAIGNAGRSYANPPVSEIDHAHGLARPESPPLSPHFFDSQSDADSGVASTAALQRAGILSPAYNPTKWEGRGAFEMVGEEIPAAVAFGPGLGLAARKAGMSIGSEYLGKRLARSLAEDVAFGATGALAATEAANQGYSLGGQLAAGVSTPLAGGLAFGGARALHNVAYQASDLYGLGVDATSVALRERAPRSILAPRINAMRDYRTASHLQGTVGGAPGVRAYRNAYEYWVAHPLQDQYEEAVRQVQGEIDKLPAPGDGGPISAGLSAPQISRDPGLETLAKDQTRNAPRTNRELYNQTHASQIATARLARNMVPIAPANSTVDIAQRELQQAQTWIERQLDAAAESLHESLPVNVMDRSGQVQARQSAAARTFSQVSALQAESSKRVREAWEAIDPEGSIPIDRAELRGVLRDELGQVGELDLPQETDLGSEVQRVLDPENDASLSFKDVVELRKRLNGSYRPDLGGSKSDQVARVELRLRHRLDAYLDELGERGLVGDDAGAAAPQDALAAPLAEAFPAAAANPYAEANQRLALARAATKRHKETFSDGLGGSVIRRTKRDRTQEDFLRQYIGGNDGRRAERARAWQAVVEEARSPEQREYLLSGMREYLLTDAYLSSGAGLYMANKPQRVEQALGRWLEEHGDFLQLDGLQGVGMQLRDSKGRLAAFAQAQAQHSYDKSELAGSILAKLAQSEPVEIAEQILSTRHSLNVEDVVRTLSKSGNVDEETVREGLRYGTYRYLLGETFQKPGLEPRGMGSLAIQPSIPDGVRLGAIVADNRATLVSLYGEEGVGNLEALADLAVRVDESYASRSTRHNLPEMDGPRSETQADNFATRNAVGNRTQGSDIGRGGVQYYRRKVLERLAATYDDGMYTLVYRELLKYPEQMMRYLEMDLDELYRRVLDRRLRTVPLGGVGAGFGAGISAPAPAFAEENSPR